MSDSNYQDPYDEASLRELCDLLSEEEGGAPSESARRTTLETLAMLPFELEPIEPSAGGKERLMAAVARERKSRAPETAVHSLAEHRRAKQPEMESTREGSTASSPGWLLPLAASLLLAVGSFAYFQSNEVRSQRRAMAEIRQQVEAVESQLQAIESDRDRARSHLAQVSRPGTEACALRPRLASAPADAHGTLYVMPDGEGWVLSLDGLEDVPGKTYQLWFLNEETALSGGTFDTGNRPYEWTNDKMPPHGTRAVAITLESQGGAAVPTGPEILFGDAEEMISFL